MYMRFSMEEINLMCIFGTENRGTLITELIESIDYFEDDVLDVALPMLDTLSKMGDEEFAVIPFYPEYGYEDENSL